MPRRVLLPADLGDIFAVREARALDIGAGRLRSADLSRPFPGVRARARARDAGEDPFEAQRRARLDRVRLFAPRLREGQYLSHESAAAIWGAPLPLAWSADGVPAAGEELALHVSTLGDGPLVRVAGVTRHRGDPRLVSVRTHLGLPVSSPASTWAQLGHLPVPGLVALGDHLCRVWRSGVGRRHVGRPPLATIAQLAAAVDAGRRPGIARLRDALPWIREDSWSPRESELRCLLLADGIPEPELNVDVFADGRFLGCADMVYREQKVAVEYLGRIHAATWGADVERLARFRAAGWTVIEVTAESLTEPRALLGRLRQALGL